MQLMNRKYTLILLLLCSTGGVFSQTLSQAQKWFTNGEFDKAKPVFQRLVKQSPSNANYNFWYGACCYETGELMEGLPYLEKSAERKVINGFLYLSKAYYDLYRFDDAITNLEDHIYWLERKKRDTSSAEDLMKKYRQGARMIRGVEKISVIDSFVVDKTDFLKAYKLSKESGTIQTAEDTNCTEFINEMGDKKILAKENAGKQNLYSTSKLIDKWESQELLKGLNTSDENLNYPFMGADGITLYYAADGIESMGGYDIFITRYDSDENTFLRPDNIGMPFNSPYNDYMYAIDDFNNLGWFASDRYQPEGKVCVYVFVPNESKQVHDYETTDPTLLTNIAMLKEIKATWNNTDKERIARQQLAQILYAQDEKKKAKDFHFIIDDNLIYHTLHDFRSEEARQMFQSLQQKEKDLTDLQRSLEKQRTQYMSTANPSEKQNMSPSILDQERRIKELYGEINQCIIQIRNKEIQKLNH